MWLCILVHVAWKLCERFVPQRSKICAACEGEKVAGHHHTEMHEPMAIARGQSRGRPGPPVSHYSKSCILQWPHQAMTICGSALTQVQSAQYVTQDGFCTPCKPCTQATFAFTMISQICTLAGMHLVLPPFISGRKVGVGCGQMRNVAVVIIVIMVSMIPGQPSWNMAAGSR